MQICTKCGEEKPLDEFYFDARRMHHRPACKLCVRRQNAEVCRQRTPAERADYRRRSGEVDPAKPYVTIDDIRTRAQHRAAKQEADRLERQMARAVSRAVTAAMDRLFIAGSEEWLAQATALQIERLMAVDRLKVERERVGLGRAVAIKLTGGDLREGATQTMVDAQDAAFLMRHAWKAKLNGSRTSIYAVRNTMIAMRCVTVRMHREVLGIGGHEGLDVDHIDRNPLNNRMANLRLVTRSQNLRNRASAA